MKVTRLLKIICPSCNGSGEMLNPNHDCNITACSTKIPCKACNGVGTQMVTEYYEAPDPSKSCSNVQ